MITLDKVTKVFASEKVIDDISFEIDEGKITGFLGPNGAGKTTTLKMITGVLRPNKGKIIINGKDIVKNSVEAKYEFGFVPDNRDMFLRLRGIEYLMFVSDIYSVPIPQRNEKIEKLSDIFEMEKDLYSTIQTYSNGMRQKLMIIASLIHNPNIWILDEPITGLDPKAINALIKIMKEYVQEGKTVFFSTHLLDVAEKICDKVILINKGKIIINNEVSKIRESLNTDVSLENIFLELTKDESGNSIN